MEINKNEELVYKPNPEYWTVADLIEELSRIEDKSRYVLIEYHDDIMYHFVHVDGMYNNNESEHSICLQVKQLYDGPCSS